MSNLQKEIMKKGKPPLAVPVSHSISLLIHLRKKSKTKTTQVTRRKKQKTLLS